MSEAAEDDVAGSAAGARETLGAMLSAAQSDLQKVFVVFVLGLVGTIWVLRNFVWHQMKADLHARTDFIQIIAVTPFDVILLQVKIGLVVGVLLAIPVLIYYSRDALRRRGWWPSQYVPRWKLAGGAIASLALFLGGIAYGYNVFFPIVFDFLASNAHQAGFEPNYSIVKWAEFVFLLSVSFGLAAQLPLMMSALAYARIIPYETWRDYWKHAIVILYGFGALFTPPDPLTQLMWATPLGVLYGVSLLLTKFVVTAREAGERVGVRTVARERWNVIAGVALVVGIAAYAIGIALVEGRLDPYLGQLPVGQFTFANAHIASFSPRSSVLVLAVLAAVGAALITLVKVTFAALDELLEREGRAGTTTAGHPSGSAGGAHPGSAGGAHPGSAGGAHPGGAGGAHPGSADGVPPASAGAPSDIDVRELDEQGVRAAPIERFADMTEDEALKLASHAMDAGDPETAQAVLDRYDEAQDLLHDDALGGGAAGGAGGAGAAGGAGESTGRSGNVVSETATGMMDAVTGSGTTEEDIGGYYYDIAFILDSLTSRAFRLVGLFMTVLAGVFFWLYQGFAVSVEGFSLPTFRLYFPQEGLIGVTVEGFSLPSVQVFVLDEGGIGVIKRDFLSRLPESVTPEQVRIVTLHPVEALIFEIKVSLIVAALATLPLLLYYAWPALKERGFAAGDRNVLVGWAGALFGGLAVGSAFGYAYVAPTIISWLASDVAQAHMVIAYRINSFGWMVFFTTVGVGLLAVVPVTMVLFHRGGLVPYRAMRDRWRVVTLGVFAVIAFLSPRGVFMMFILGIPVLLAYAFGLAIIWAYTLGGRREPGPSRRAG